MDLSRSYLLKNSQKAINKIKKQNNNVNNKAFRTKNYLSPKAEKKVNTMLDELHLYVAPLMVNTVASYRVIRARQAVIKKMLIEENGNIATVTHSMLKNRARDYNVKNHCLPSNT